MSEAKHYRCKHNIEVRAWGVTAMDLAVFAAWFAEHDVQLVTKHTLDKGCVLVLPDDLGEVTAGELVAWSNNEFIVMTQDALDEDYEEIK